MRLQQGQVVARNFEVVDLLGEGGMGAVYRATQLSIRARCALKIIKRPPTDRKAGSRFEREVRALGELRALSHPGIVTILDAGLDEQLGVFFVAMELLEGMTLQECLDSGPQPIEQCAQWAAQAFGALAAAHRQGIVHLDIKPGNIFLTQVYSASQVKLVDFGLARLLEDGVVTEDGAGTPGYSSPEQIARTSQVGPPSDVFSMGATLFRLLTGEPIATGVKEYVREQIVRGEYRRHPAALRTGIAPWLDAAVAGALELQPAARPSAQQLTEALTMRRTSLPPASTELSAEGAGRPIAFPSRALGRLRTLPRSLRVLLVTGGASLLAGALIISLCVTRKHVEPPGPEPTSSATVAWNDDASPVPVSSADPMQGDRTAGVTFVQFGDLESPFHSLCRERLKRLANALGKSKVRLIWKHRPLAIHPRARAGATWAQAVFLAYGQEAFWRFVDAAFEKRAALGDRKGLSELARKSGALDIPRIEKLVDEGAKRVDGDMALAHKISIWTPGHLYMNGREVPLDSSFEELQRVAQAELDRVAEELTTGTAPDKLYVRLSIANRRLAAELGKKKTGADPLSDEAMRFRVLVGPSPVIGPSDALVTIVEFADYQCPFCRRVQPTLEKLKEEYGGKLRFVWKDMPLSFHPRAFVAAAVGRQARAAGAPFLKVHEALFASAGSAAALGDSDLRRILAEFGAAEADLEIVGARQSPFIGADEIDADRIGVRGTPMFLINGRPLSGAQKADAFERIINQELTAVDELTRIGVPATGIYDELMTLAMEGTPLESSPPPVPPPGTVSRGTEGAVLRIVQFGDLLAQGRDLDRILADYPGKVQHSFRHLPSMRDGSQEAAEIAIELRTQLGDAAFWKFRTRVEREATQPTAAHPRAGISLERLLAIAHDLGANLTDMRLALSSKRHAGVLDGDLRAAVAAGLRSGGVFVGNFFLGPSPGYGRLKRAVDSSLEGSAP